MRLTLCALGIVALTVIAMNCGAGALDGIRAKVRIVLADAPADKSDQGFDDTLSFADGKFSSTVFLAKGFQPAGYHGEREEHEAEFDVSQTNGVGEVIDWLGNIGATHVGGRLQWMKKDGTRVSYYFNGTEEPNTGSSTNTAAVPAAHK
ncbi:MAG: hypothetical protein ACLPT4_05225 [Verrucomicrobiia bacterium]